METFNRLLRDRRSSWSKKTKDTSMPIPVPLDHNETVGDYQQKFEFWLAQRNVTLAALRDNVIRERSYRCGYAQWRVQKQFGQPAPINASTTADSAYGPQRGRSRSPARTRREQENDRFFSTRSRSPARSFAHQGGFQRSASTPRPSRFYDARRVRRYDDEKTGTQHDQCNNCGRDWAELNRRVTQLESILSRLDLPTASIFDGRGSSPYEINGGMERPRDESSSTSNFIDLTDDFEDDAEGDVRSEMGGNREGRATDTTMTDIESRSVEITPSDSDTNHEVPPTTEDLDEPSTEPVQEYELKLPPGLTAFIDAYNHINGRALSKQKEEKKAVADMESMANGEETSETELQSRLCELREAIKLEKGKRDAAVAAVIACGCAKKKEKFARDMETMGGSGTTNEQENLHEKCAGIAAQVAEKEKELARLQKQLQSVSSLEESDSLLGQREAQDLSNKIGLERASKMSLETERLKIFSRLMKSSRQIQALVAKELSRKV